MQMPQRSYDNAGWLAKFTYSSPHAPPCIPALPIYTNPATVIDSNGIFNKPAIHALSLVSNTAFRLTTFRISLALPNALLLGIWRMMWNNDNGNGRISPHHISSGGPC